MNICIGTINIVPLFDCNNAFLKRSSKLSDMNYRTKIKSLMEQVSRTDWDFFEACKTQNRKVFPFYCHASLCCHYVNNKQVAQPKIPYDDYPETSMTIFATGDGWYGKI